MNRDSEDVGDSVFESFNYRKDDINKCSKLESETHYVSCRRYQTIAKIVRRMAWWEPLGAIALGEWQLPKSKSGLLFYEKKLTSCCVGVTPGSVLVTRGLFQDEGGIIA